MQMVQGLDGFAVRLDLFCSNDERCGTIENRLLLE